MCYFGFFLFPGSDWFVKIVGAVAEYCANCNLLENESEIEAILLRLFHEMQITGGEFTCKAKQLLLTALNWKKKEIYMIQISIEFKMWQK